MLHLQNQLLLAMPSLKESFFERSLIYICEHSNEGAMGLAVNLPLELPLKELLQQLKIETLNNVKLEQPVLQGGPVATDRGFVLHTQRSGYSSSLRVNDELMVTTSKDILENLASEGAPQNYLVALGYCGWSAGQLEEEIAQGSWLIVPMNNELLFNTPIHRRWQAAALSIGINPLHLSDQVGHA